MKLILKDFLNVVEQVEIYNDSFPYSNTNRGIIHLENTRTLKSIIPEIKTELGIGVGDSEDKEIILCSRNVEESPTETKLTEISDDLTVENLKYPYRLVIITKNDMIKYNEYVDNIKCPICFNSLKNLEPIIRLNCNHAFHENCISNSRERSNTCPKCRTVISKRNRVNYGDYKIYLHYKIDGKRKSTKRNKSNILMRKCPYRKI